MSSDHMFEHKGKVKPKPKTETAEPEKDKKPISTSQRQSELDANTLTHLQQTVGNAAVQRYLAQREDSGPSEVEDDTASAIQSKRGSGQALDSGMADKAGQTMGQDFSDVNVHTDDKSDELNKQLGAKAFTTGNDIFFSSGAYDPGSSDGQRLISHELTHVAQQGGSPPSGQEKMSVNDPNDQYEAEADHTADMVMNQPEDASVQRQEEEEVMTKADETIRRQEEEELQLQPEEEEEEEPIQAQEEEELQMQEEEELQMQEEEELQMQEEEELQLQDEEELQLQDEEELQLQPIEEEEEMLQPKRK